MRSVACTLIGAAMLAMVNGQGVITSAKGASGESKALAVDATNPADANFISDAEINANVVNECGRTLTAGNIDVGESTETALAADAVTQVTQGSTVKMTIDQVNANGTGPYTCDMDPQGNALATGQIKLDVKETDNGGTTTLSVTMPKDMACTGSSAGNVCTVRCRNAADFGGCVAVQQTDVTPLAGDNPPSNITTAASLAAIESQVQQDRIDLPAAIAGNEAATKVGDQGVKIAQAILDADPAIVKAQAAELATKAATADTAAASTATNKNGNNNAGKKNKGNKNGGNANAAAGNANAATGNANANANTNANAKGNGNGRNKNNNNNNNRSQRLRRFQRGRRFVAADVAFDEAADN